MGVDLAFKALADPRRREILRLVWDQELPATTIAANFADVSRPAISQHLGVLKAAGLLTERRAGTRRLYCTDHRELRKLRTYLESFWSDSLAQLRELAEAAEATTTPTSRRS